MNQKDYLKLSPIVDQHSEWVGNSLMRATVRNHKATYVIQVMELTEGRTSKRRALDFAKAVAANQKGVRNFQEVPRTAIEFDRKCERLDGTHVLTRIRNVSYMFNAE